jgi:hypothetical protein
MKANGRVDILNASKRITSYDNTPKVYTSEFKDALTGIWENTPLSNTFFSPQNQQIIQNGIRAGVYKLSNNKYVIAQQSDTDIKVVMRSIYLNHCQNRIGNIKEQIQELNQYVFDYCIPRIYGEAQGYMNYLRDASTLVVPMARPIYTATNKTLELKPFF